MTRYQIKLLTGQRCTTCGDAHARYQITEHRYYGLSSSAYCLPCLIDLATQIRQALQPPVTIPGGRVSEPATTSTHGAGSESTPEDPKL